MKIKIYIIQVLLVVMILSLQVSAQLNVDSLKRVVFHSNNEEALMSAYNDYAYLLYRSQADSAIYYAEKALSIAEKLNSNKEIFSAYNLLGLAWQTKGSYNLSIEYFKKELEYLPENDLNRAKTYHNMALTYRFLNNNNEALTHEVNALKISENNRDSVTVGVIYQTMCNIYRDMEDYELAEKYILKSIDIFEKVKNTGIDNRLSMLANAYSNYGNMLQKTGRLTEAVENHKKAAILQNESGDLYNKAIVYENLADDYKLMKRYSEALINYNLAKDIMQQLNSETDVGYELMKIAEIYKETGEYSFALANLDSALNIFTRNHADAYRLDVYNSKYKVYDLIGNTELALQFYKKYNVLKDSLNTESKKLDLLRLKEEFEVTQKEQQIVLLETENALKDKEKQVQIVFRNIALLLIGILFVFGILLINRYRINQKVKQLEIRNSIAADLHDDIGSTLSSIRMYSEIVSDQVKENNPESIPLLQHMSENSKEMMENMSDIVWAIKPANDEFKNIESRIFNFATELCNAKNISLVIEQNVNLTGFKLPMEIRRDLYLIFKEALNNAVKYSACSKIEITFKRAGNIFEMQIIDNGIGFNPSDLNENKDLKPRMNGNGLKNLKLRAEKHNGELIIDSSPGKGTRVILTIPIP
ncbi:MAG: tetratricopeptide repeat protein [Chitinophagales bacterium]|nr:tetratricopeptide repeat protein [Chitinophagales bacterium]